MRIAMEAAASEKRRVDAAPSRAENVEYVFRPHST